MKKKRNKRIKIVGRSSFVWYNVLMFAILFGSLAFSIVDTCQNVVPWPENYENTIGVATQIITGIASLVVSIIGIAISLQNEDFFGVKKPTYMHLE